MLVLLTETKEVVSQRNMEEHVCCIIDTNNLRKGETAMTLGDAKVGSTVVVTKIEGDSAYKRRIMDMGITKGAEIYIRKVAPLGDPIEVAVRGYELSLRKADAEMIETE